jgi:L-ascorbate metabolism protein UlaG (beta-lactamase superfamily)
VSLHVTGVPRTVTWWGHSTVLIQVGDTAVLTDPVLRGRVAHLTRRAPLPREGELGAPDAVLLSHAHRDHLDRATLRKWPAAVTVVPRGVGAHVPAEDGVVELDVGEEVGVGETTVRAVPAIHDVRRGGRSTPALGFVVDGDIYFAGDTDRFEGMGTLGPLELALIPVWGWGTSLGAGHLDPRGAAEAIAEIRPRVAIPIHWGTYFPLHRPGHHRLLHDPPREFRAIARELAPEVEVRLLEVGETCDLEGGRSGAG